MANVAFGTNSITVEVPHGVFDKFDPQNNRRDKWGTLTDFFMTDRNHRNDRHHFSSFDAFLYTLGNHRRYTFGNDLKPIQHASIQVEELEDEQERQVKAAELIEERE
jgi:hypothetical protein